MGKLDDLLHCRPVRFIIDMIQVYFDKHISRSAAELAYFMILTFFPLLICLNAFLGALELDITTLVEVLERMLPSEVSSIVVDYVGYVSGNQSRGMLLAGVFTMLFFAASAVRGLMNAMEDIFGSALFHGLGRTVASFVISLLLLIAMYVAVAVVVTGNWFFHLLEQLLHLEGLVERLNTFQWMKYLILLDLVFLMVLILYRVCLPRVTGLRPPVVLGAALAAITLAASTVVFSWFISFSTRYSLVYGSLASVIILLVWLYLCGNILILGNVFNYVWFCHRRKL